MNSRVDKIHDFVKMNVQLMANNKKGNQVPSQATTNLRNQGASSSQVHNVNYLHIDKEAVEMALAISCLRSGKDLPYLYKDHPIHQGPIIEETLTIVEEDNDSEDEEEHTKAKPNPATYKPPVPYPQTLNRPKTKTNESKDHLLDALKR